MFHAAAICAAAFVVMRGRITDNGVKRIGKGRGFAPNSGGGRLRTTPERPFDTSIAELLRCVVGENGEAG